MVNKLKQITVIFIFLNLFHGTTASMYGSKMRSKVYIDLKTQTACFRILNATHQVGCGTSPKGNMGTVHYVQSEQDIDWIVYEGQLAPYVVVIKAQDFTRENVQRLKQGSRVSGMMVISNETDLPSNGQSMVDQCPTDRFGLYHNRTEYKGCQKVVWNPPGTGFQFQDFGFPVFSLTDEEDIDNVLNKCFPYNLQSQDSPESSICVAEMRSVMYAVMDTEFCMRRSRKTQFSLASLISYCEPMGGHNIITTMRSPSHKETRENDSVIMVAAKLDATSLFWDNSPAADTTAVALVTMLVTAQALWSVRDDIINVTTSKDIMFAFFQGETFDYIGSKRTVYDMKQKKFPQDVSGTGTFLHPIDLEHIGQILELNQVGHRQFGKSLFAHMDPLAPRPVMEKVMIMVDSLQTFGQANHVDIEPASQTLPLPPASAQTFLSNRLDIPTVVLTDHKDQFTNKYYNSIYDLPKLIKADYPENMTEKEAYDYVTPQATLIANLSSTLARYLYKASTGIAPSLDQMDRLTGNTTMATHLLYCLVVDAKCPIFHETSDKVHAKKINEKGKIRKPFTFYTSVYRNIAPVTSFVYSLMARFSGELVPFAGTEVDCQAFEKSSDIRYSYTWMAGTKQCMKSTVIMTMAKSPAFDIEGYDMTSGQYPTWTESTWPSYPFSIRLFLVPRGDYEMITFAMGLGILVFSFLIIYQLSHNAHVMFPDLMISSNTTTTSTNSEPIKQKA